MELSEADRATLATPLEGNTISAVVGVVKVLAKIVLADADRLSPPAPEVDEATKIAREFVARFHARAGFHKEAERAREGKYDKDGLADIAYLRTALSELIASKDAEIEKAKRSALGLASCGRRYSELYSEAESELAAISAAIGTTEFMDPPDGGSPTLAEQVGRMRAEIVALRAENERLKTDLDRAHRVQFAKDNANAWPGSASMAGADTIKAAERKTAEPALDGETSVFPPMAKATDTTPEVVVTQEGAMSAQIYADYHCEDATWKVDCAERLATEFDRVRTEAEARGRREALEAATARLEWYRQYGAGMIDQRGFAASLIAELKRMMTEPKP